ncbi:MAG: hypothetical protein IT425_05745 [Pirellulales bacterium]|nr:hypothetical protein [Pirellulales bacterium]
MGQTPRNDRTPDDLAADEFAGIHEQLDSTQELVWALLDDHISDADFAELEERLLADKDARETYIQCVQLHAELLDHFKGGAAKPVAEQVLGFLGSATPTTSTPSNPVS